MYDMGHNVIRFSLCGHWSRERCTYSFAVTVTQLELSKKIYIFLFEIYLRDKLKSFMKAVYKAISFIYKMIHISYVNIKSSKYVCVQSFLIHI